jgi:hypothetical protein
MKIRGSVLLMLAVVSVLAMVSCTKKYTCQCQLKYTGAPGMPDSVVNEYEIYDTKTKATDLCKKESYEKEENGIKITETCKLY